MLQTYQLFHVHCTLYTVQLSVKCDYYFSSFIVIKKMCTLSPNFPNLTAYLRRTLFVFILCSVCLLDVTQIVCFSTLSNFTIFSIFIFAEMDRFSPCVYVCKKYRCENSGSVHTDVQHQCNYINYCFFCEFPLFNVTYVHCMY